MTVQSISRMSMSWHSDQAHPVQRPIVWALAGGSVLVLMLGLLAGRAGLIRFPGAGQTVPDDWLVVQCDVGQGSATLLNTGGGRAIMVDTGPDPALASRCLRQQHVRALDLIVITHFHADHAGGLTGVPMQGQPPILVSPFARPAEQAASVRAVAARAGSAVIAGHAGMNGGPVDDPAVRWSLLSPPAVEATRLQATSASGSPSAQDDGTQINDASLAMLVELRGARVMLLGDLETDAQRMLTSPSPVTPVDVVVVAHHGSALQYPPLYAALRPRVALIGVGQDNDYGHPAPTALAMLGQTRTRVLRTDTGGRLTVAGSAVHLRTESAK